MGVRLNLGCGNRPEPGYTNVDVRPGPGVDVVADLLYINRSFRKVSVDEIYMRHVLEHFTPEDARVVLHGCFDILRPGGVMHVIVPDLAFHCQQFLGLVQSTAVDQMEHAMRSFYGWRLNERGGNTHDAHRWGYDYRSLKALLYEVGFVNAARLANQPWHLDVRVIRPFRAETQRMSVAA